MNWETSAGTSQVMPAIPGPAIEPCTATALSEAEGDWLCAWCLNRVANDRDRFKYEGEDEFTFSNPEGIRFEIITFSQTPGCHCDRCDQHVGWYYVGQHDFAGLITDRIVRAQCIRN